jgi:hypothetical protein
MEGGGGEENKNRNRNIEDLSIREGLFIVAVDVLSR